MHTAFLHFVVRSQRSEAQSRFYYFGRQTLALIFVFDANIYSCRIYKSSTSNPSTIFHFSVVFAVPRWLRVTLIVLNSTFIALKEFVFQASDIANISRTEDFRKRYLYLLKVVDKICCFIRPTSA